MTIYEQIERAVDFIETSLADVHQETAAREAGMSARSFQGYFWAVTGHSFKAYVIKRRLTLALAALDQLDKRVLDIALEVGYQSHEALTRAFQHEFGVTPQAYRRSRPALEGLAAPRLYKEKYMGVIIKELPELRVAVFEGHGTGPEDKAKALWKAWAANHPDRGQTRRVFGHNIDTAGTSTCGPDHEGYCFLVSLEPGEVTGGPATRALVAGRFVVTGIEGNFTDDPEGGWISEGWARMNAMMKEKGYRAKAGARWFEEELEPQTPGNLRLDLYLEIG